MVDNTVPNVSKPQTRTKKRRRIVQNGLPTNELVFSAHVGGNETVFPQVLSLYVPDSSVIADVTYGEGVFWRNIPENQYKVLGTDIQDGVDCRELPYADGEIDCVVLDPPYMHSPGGTAHTDQARSKGIIGTTEPEIELRRNTMMQYWHYMRKRALRPIECSEIRESLSSNARMKCALIANASRM